MKHWSLYRLDDGMLAGIVIGGPDDGHLASNVPDGYGAIEGEHDHLSRRVDLATRQLVDWQPPQPSADHEWNAEARRWQKRADVVAAESAAIQAQAAIDVAELGSLRAIREALLETLPQNSPARTRLEEFDEAIAAERAKLSPAAASGS